ncbi:MAG TPA: c-type cytochrome [Bryobacterales bacterium]|nr:c-type cytochrome [Bryobacterales bacterium]
MRYGFLPLLPLLLGLAACSANTEPSKVEEKVANFAKRVVIPLEAKQRKNPLQPDPAVIQEGMQLYGQSCSMCHGADGTSATAIGCALYPPAMDLTSPHVKSWTDSELFWIVQNGVRFTGMPSWHGILNDDQTWKVVLAIRDLEKAQPKPPATPAGELTRDQLIQEGKLLFQQENCIGCHMLNGEGGRVGPDLSGEGDKGRTDQWLIGHFQNPPAYTPGSLMPAATNLNEQRLQALTAFLQAQKQGKGKK